jgi:hypothetical protein
MPSACSMLMPDFVANWIARIRSSVLASPFAYSAVAPAICASCSAVAFAPASAAS